MASTNQEVAKILREMTVLYEMEEIPFKPRAYERAALSIESLSEEAVELYKKGGEKRLLEIPGVGPGIAAHLAELFSKGHFKEYERLKKKIPVDIIGITAIEGVGPQMAKILWQKLKIHNVEELERATRAGKISILSHFGKKTEEKILKGIEFLKKAGGKRVLGFIFPEIQNIEKIIKEFPEIEKVVIAGSVRRRKETIGDIDILAVSKNPEKVMERFLALPFVAHVYGSGTTKTNVKLKNGLDADLRVVPEKSFGAALNYFTGSKEHNVALREIAIKKGMKLNEYGLFRGEKFMAGRTEEELYKVLGLQYIEPEMREMNGEIEVARENKLPKLIGYNDLKGDLQVQTDWTDGQDSMEKMARAACDMGLEYVAITDHTRSLAMTGGSDEKKLRAQMKEIDKLNKKLAKEKIKFTILKGAEVNIDKKGELDISDEVLKELDVVGVAIHSNFNMSRADQTARVIRAMENPNVDIVFHLTTRIINQRPAIELDVDAVIHAAKKQGVVIEIDAFPSRLDIKDEYIRKCVEAGVKLSIDSDAHSVKHFKYLEYGVAQARRGWARREDIINAWPVEKMLGFLRKYKECGAPHSL